MIDEPVDLFGRPLARAEYSTTGPYGQRKLQMGYHRAEKGATERCGTCINHVKKQFANCYHKCRIIGCSSSASTDIRVGFVCRHWKGKNAPEIQTEP